MKQTIKETNHDGSLANNVPATSEDPITDSSSESLCWKCRRATSVAFQITPNALRTRCPWVCSCSPVKGWTVQNKHDEKGDVNSRKRQNPNDTCYFVVDCPLYEADLEAEIKALPKEVVATYFKLPLSAGYNFIRPLRKTLYSMIQNLDEYLAYLKDESLPNLSLKKMSSVQIHNKITELINKNGSSKTCTNLTPPALPTVEAFHEVIGENWNAFLLLALHESLYYTYIEYRITKKYEDEKGIVEDAPRFETLCNLYKKLLAYVIKKQNVNKNDKHKRYLALNQARKGAPRDVIEE